MKKYLLILFVIILLILGFAFYWFEYRPSMIVKKCSEISNGSGLASLANKYTPGYNQTTKEINYKNCLRKNGLEK